MYLTDARVGINYDLLWFRFGCHVYKRGEITYDFTSFRTKSELELMLLLEWRIRTHLNWPFFSFHLSIDSNSFINYLKRTPLAVNKHHVHVFVCSYSLLYNNINILYCNEQSARYLKSRRSNLW